MPISTWKSISQILDIMMLINPLPQSVLDIGIGNGKYGFLTREYLTFWGSRYEAHRRKITIDGIEAFPDYVGSVQRNIYDQIIFGNAKDILRTMPNHLYDLIVFIDVLEHFSVEDGLQVIQECIRIGETVIISTPIEMEDQGAAFGNEFERHLSVWSPNMLMKTGAANVFNCADQNWLAIYSTNNNLKTKLNEYQKVNFGWRKSVKYIFPYEFRKIIGKLMRRFSIK
jgi:hypothetical protein